MNFSIFALLQGAQKEQLTDELLAAATFPNAMHLDVLKLLRALVPRLYDESSIIWAGTFAVRAGNGQELLPLFFMFERMVAERLGLLLTQSWKLRLVLPTDLMPFALRTCFRSPLGQLACRDLQGLDDFKLFLVMFPRLLK